nr:uncharacterized protein LOC109183466 [Ipomoea trifida]
MDHLADAEEQMVTEIMRQKLNEITAATEAQLSGVKDHVNFTLQKAYFKCAYECFDRNKTQEEIGNCVEYCSVPVLKAHYLVEDETAKFAVNSLLVLDHTVAVLSVQAVKVDIQGIVIDSKIISKQKENQKANLLLGKRLTALKMFQLQFQHLALLYYQLLPLPLSDMELDQSLFVHRFTRVTKLSCSQPLSFLCALVADSKSFRWNTLELKEDSYILCFKRFLEHHLHPSTKEYMKRSLTLCQDKFVAAKLQQDGNAIKVLESCVDLSTQHCLKTLPYLVRQLKTSLGITE